MVVYVFPPARAIGLSSLNFTVEDEWSKTEL